MRAVIQRVSEASVTVDNQITGSIDNGLLTPTLKIKRNVIKERFAKQITELYRGHLMVE